MKTKRRVELIFERNRTIVYAGRYPKEVRWCPACRESVEMITVFDAAKFLGVTSATIQSWVDEAAIHGHTNNRGVLLVCSRSISYRAERDVSEQ